MVANSSACSLSQLPASPSTARSRREASSKNEAERDSNLIARFLAGDDSAFAEIVTHYRAKMYSIALCHLRNHSDAEEIAQDTLIRAHRGLARFRGDSSLATWLHRIAFNLSRNRHMHNTRRRRQDTLSLDCALSDANQETFADMIACEAPGPAREAAVGEFSETVEECMNRLAPSHREVLIMRTGLSQSYFEIAQELGLKIGTVKSRIGRARECLRELLVETYPEMEFDKSGDGWFEPARPSGRIAMASA